MKTFMMLLAILVLLFVVVGLGRKLCCKQKIVDGQIAGLTSLSEEKSGALSKRLMPQSVANAEEQAQLVRRSTEAARSPQAEPTAAKEMLRSVPKPKTDSASPSPDIARLAAEKSQLMDDCERRISSSHSLLKRLADDPKENAVVRKSAFRALWALDGL